MPRSTPKARGIHDLGGNELVLDIGVQRAREPLECAIEVAFPTGPKGQRLVGIDVPTLSSTDYTGLYRVAFGRAYRATLRAAPQLPNRTKFVDDAHDARGHGAHPGRVPPPGGGLAAQRGRSPATSGSCLSAHSLYDPS